MQYETCRHVKEDGAYCGSPALRDRKYCYYHLMQRGRRLRRARALRDNLPYRLEIQSLGQSLRRARRPHRHRSGPRCRPTRSSHRRQDSLRHPAGQPNQPPHRADGSRRAAKESVPQVRAPLWALTWVHADDYSRIQEYPDFEKQFGLPPGADLDAETDAVLRKADEEAEFRQGESLPEPPPGVRPGSPAYRVYREEAYQMMRLQLTGMRHQLRDYNEQKRQQLEESEKGDDVSDPHARAPRRHQDGQMNQPRNR